MSREIGQDQEELEEYGDISNPVSRRIAKASPSTNFIILNEAERPPGARRTTLRDLHPLTRPLTIGDLESCVTLENAAFEERERCSREKVIRISIKVPKASLLRIHVWYPDQLLETTGSPVFCINPLNCWHRFLLHLSQYDERTRISVAKFDYRLTTCGELSLGIFCTASPDSELPAETIKTGRPVETGREDEAVGVLLAHIVSTKSNDQMVTDQSMDYPRDYKSSSPKEKHINGHQDKGRTICLHSLGVLPSYQGLGLGKIIMSAYLQQMAAAGIADRIALIAHDHLVEYYKRLGFTKVGPSKAQFGGGGWIDMVFDFNSVESALWQV